MAKEKKNGNQDRTLQILVLVTAILNLIRAILDTVEKPLEEREGDALPPLWGEGIPPLVKQNNSSPCHCQCFFERMVYMLRTVIDIAIIVVSIVAIVVVVRQWKR